MNKNLQMSATANVNTQAMLGVETNEQNPHFGMIPEFYEDDVIPLVRKYIDPLLMKFKIPKPNADGKIKGPSLIHVKFFKEALQKTKLPVNIVGKYTKHEETFFIFCAQTSKLKIKLEEREMNWYPEVPHEAGVIN